MCRTLKSAPSRLPADVLRRALSLLVERPAPSAAVLLRRLAGLAEDAGSAPPASDDAVDRLLAHSVRLGLDIRIFGFDGYPDGLRRLRVPPPFLFIKGLLDRPRHPRVAIVGSRDATDWGRATADECSRAAVRAGAVVVSGLATGIDTAAHQAALAAEGITWAVVAHGLDMVYPAENRDLAAAISKRGGALIAEYPPGERPEPHRFIERDRIQAGLSDAVLVVETTLDGGAMHTARFAREAGIPVWVTLPEPMRGQPVDQLPAAHQGQAALLVTGAMLIAAPASVGPLVAVLCDTLAVGGDDASVPVTDGGSGCTHSRRTRPGRPTSPGGRTPG